VENEKMEDRLIEGYKGFLKEVNPLEMSPDWTLSKGQDIWSDLIEHTINQQNIPNNATFTKLTFTLTKPFISQDDDDFYPIDNPVCKDKVFKVPLLRPSSIKGAVEYAAYWLWMQKREEAILKSYNRMFATDIQKAKREEESPQMAGRVRFFPLFFDKIGIEVITPLERDTKTPARGPIYFESVPESENGYSLYLLYYPFDRLKEIDEYLPREYEKDLSYLFSAIVVAIELLGIGAKTTSGYGTGRVNNIEVINAPPQLNIDTLRLDSIRRLLSDTFGVKG
jgi:CRISPR-associated protein Cmr2